MAVSQLLQTLQPRFSLRINVKLWKPFSNPFSDDCCFLEFLVDWFKLIFYIGQFFQLSTSHTSRSEAETETYPSPGTGTNLSDDTEDDSVIEKKLSVGIFFIKCCYVNFVYRNEMK